MSSKIIVDTIEKKTGDDVTLVGNLDVPTSYKITGTDADSIQAPGLITSAGSGLNTSLNTGLASATFPTQIIKIGAAVLFDGFSSGTKTSSDSEIKSVYNVTSVQRTEAGVFRITFTSALSSSDFYVLGTVGIDNASRTFMVKVKTTTYLDIRIRNYGDQNKDDFSSCSVVAFVL